MPLLAAGGVGYTWIYQHTNRSILAAALLHGLGNLFLASAPTAEAEGHPEVIRLILRWVIAIALVAKNGPNLARRTATKSPATATANRSTP